MKLNLLSKLTFVFLFLFISSNLYPQELETIKMLQYTPVKNQGRSGTCWCFSVLSIMESELMKQGIEQPNLSELFIVRNIYIEKAKNYILRQGFTRFTEGAFGHDVFPAVTKYGLMTDEAYSIYQDGRPVNHTGFDEKLKRFLDSVLVKIPISPDWEKNYVKMLDARFGKPPEKFMYKGTEYTPLEFAEKVIKFNPDYYIGLTSYTHHPFYKPFNVEVPDNYSGGLFYNIPIDELIKAAEDAVMKGYSVGWDADVSNPFFKQQLGYAMNPAGVDELYEPINPDAKEVSYTQQSRQELFENLTTQDDHLMHIVGLKKSKGGKLFFYVKNSWGSVGPFQGFLNVSETNFAINTLTLILPVNGLTPELRKKLGK